MCSGKRIVVALSVFLFGIALTGCGDIADGRLHLGSHSEIVPLSEAQRLQPQEAEYGILLLQFLDEAEDWDQKVTVFHEEVMAMPRHTKNLMSCTAKSISEKIVQADIYMPIF